MRHRDSSRVLALALLLGLAAAAAAGPEVVAFQTEDRLTITGDLWSSGKKGAPAVVALHMYPSNRTSWQPIAGLFETAGIDFLAIDMRGYGDSAKQGRRDLSESVQKRESKLFRAMWRDALAAYAFLVGRGAGGRGVGRWGRLRAGGMPPSDAAWISGVALALAGVYPTPRGRATTRSALPPHPLWRIIGGAQGLR